MPKKCCKHQLIWLYRLLWREECLSIVFACQMRWFWQERMNLLLMEVVVNTVGAKTMLHAQSKDLHGRSIWTREHGESINMIRWYAPKQIGSYCRTWMRNCPCFYLFKSMERDCSAVVVEYECVTGFTAISLTRDWSRVWTNSSLLQLLKHHWYHVPFSVDVVSWDWLWVVIMMWYRRCIRADCCRTIRRLKFRKLQF